MIFFVKTITLHFSGSETAKESEAAGQLQDSKDVIHQSRQSFHTESTVSEEHKVVFNLAGDTDSVESLEMHSKTEHDTDVIADDTSIKAEDDVDGGLFPTRTSRLSSTDSYLSHQDSMKSLPWYGSSLDFDVGPYSKYPSSEPQNLLQLDKISESSLERNLEDLHVGPGPHRTMNRTSTPAHEVRLEIGEVGGNAAPLRPVKEEFDHDMGGRSSPESSGRGLFPVFVLAFKTLHGA